MLKSSLCVRCPPRRRLRAWGWSGVAAAGVLMVFLTAGPQHHECEMDCGVHSWMNAPHPQSKLFIDHIIADVIEPQRATVPDPLTAEEVGRPLREDTSAFTVNQFLLGYIDNIVNGTFVEVGAGDGEFLSFSGLLELLLQWKGLLIEPRQDAYLRLRQRRRAASANVCVTGGDYHRKELLWVPAVDESLSAVLQRAAASKAALNSYVDADDRADGSGRLVQCYTLSALVTAYLRSIDATDQFIDLLILDTNAGELLMMENLTIPRFRYLLIPIRDKFEYEYAVLNGHHLGLNITNTETLQFGYALFQDKTIAKTVIALPESP